MTDIWDALPDRCFVSHSYRDTNVVSRLQRKPQLTTRLEAFVRVEPDPSHAVSDSIVTRILDCGALIYLRGGASASSFWVSFERDYALRAGLPVYSYDPSLDTLVRDDGYPLALDLHLVFHHEDERRVAMLLDWMKEKRHVALNTVRSRTQLGGVTGDLVLQLEQMLQNGGPILWLGSKRVVIPIQVFATEMAGQLGRTMEFRDTFVDRLLSASDGTVGLGAEEFVQDGDLSFCSEVDPYLYTSQVITRVDGSLPSGWQPPAGDVLDLLQGDGESYDWNRVDDLIIRLYGAVLQQRRRRAASPPQSHAVSIDEIGLLVMYWDENPDWTGRVRVGAGHNRPPSAGERWWLGTWDAQVLFDESAKVISEVLAKRPSRVDRHTHPHLPFDDELPPACALAWRVAPAVVELSLVREGPHWMVFVRRYLISSIEGGLS